MGFPFYGKTISSGFPINNEIGGLNTDRRNTLHVANMGGEVHKGVSDEYVHKKLYSVAVPNREFRGSLTHTCTRFPITMRDLMLISHPIL